MKTFVITGSAGLISSHLAEKLLFIGNHVLVVDNFLQVANSISEVYVDTEVHPQPESYWGRVNPIGIRSCYDEGKRCAETLFFDYHRQHELDIKV